MYSGTVTAEGKVRASQVIPHFLWEVFNELQKHTTVG